MNTTIFPAKSLLRSYCLGIALIAGIFALWRFVVPQPYFSLLSIIVVGLFLYLTVVALLLPIHRTAPVPLKWNKHWLWLVALSFAAIAYYAWLKNSFMMDEIFNLHGGGFPATIMNSWIDSQNIAQMNRINWMTPNEIVQMDITGHPPLYRMIYQSVFALFQELSPDLTRSFAQMKWLGIALNIPFFVLSIPVFYLLVGLLTRSAFIVAVGITLYSLSFYIISMVLFIRMYELFIVLSLLLLLAAVYLLYNQSRPNWIFWVTYALINTFGVLTQYYFVPFAVLVNAYLLLVFFYRKDWNTCIMLLVSGISAILLFLIFFPEFLTAFNSNMHLKVAHDKGGADYYWHNFLTRSHMLLSYAQNLIYQGSFYGGTLVFLVGLALFFRKNRLNKYFNENQLNKNNLEQKNINPNAMKILGTPRQTSFSADYLSAGLLGLLFVGMFIFIATTTPFGGTRYMSVLGYMAILLSLVGKGYLLHCGYQKSVYVLSGLMVLLLLPAHLRVTGKFNRETSVGIGIDFLDGETHCRFPNLAVIMKPNVNTLSNSLYSSCNTQWFLTDDLNADLSAALQAAAPGLQVVLITSDPQLRPSIPAKLVTQVMLHWQTYNMFFIPR